MARRFRWFTRQFQGVELAAMPNRDGWDLPGQDHPGLGMLREIYGWLIVLCEALHLDGIAFVPSHYYMVALGKRLLRFLDPMAQARFEAMYDALGRLTLAEASHALEAGRIRDAKTGTLVEWQPSVMVVPVSRKLRSLLEVPSTPSGVRLNEGCSSSGSGRRTPQPLPNEGVVGLPELPSQAPPEIM